MTTSSPSSKTIHSGVPLLLPLACNRQLPQLADGQQPRVGLRDLHGVSRRTQGVSRRGVSLKLRAARARARGGQFPSQSDFH